MPGAGRVDGGAGGHCQAPGTASPGSPPGHPRDTPLGRQPRYSDVNSQKKKEELITRALAAHAGRARWPRGAAGAAGCAEKMQPVAGVERDPPGSPRDTLVARAGREGGTSSTRRARARCQARVRAEPALGGGRGARGASGQNAQRPVGSFFGLELWSGTARQRGEQGLSLPAASEGLPWGRGLAGTETGSHEGPGSAHAASPRLLGCRRCLKRWHCWAAGPGPGMPERCPPLPGIPVTPGLSCSRRGACPSPRCPPARPGQPNCQRKSLQTSPNPLPTGTTAPGRRRRVELRLCPAENSRNPGAKQSKNQRSQNIPNSTARAAPARGGDRAARGARGAGSARAEREPGRGEQPVPRPRTGQGSPGCREGSGITSGWYCIATGAEERLPRPLAEGLVLGGSPWCPALRSGKRELENLPSVASNLPELLRTGRERRSRRSGGKRLRSCRHTGSVAAALGPGLVSGGPETKEKLPMGTGGCAGGTGRPDAGARPPAAVSALPTASFPSVFGFCHGDAGGVFSSRELLGARASGRELAALGPDVLIGDGQVGGSHARGVLRGEERGVSAHRQPPPAQALHGRGSRGRGGKLAPQLLTPN